MGWYRETEAHSVGVRTFPIVAVAACGYVLLSAPPEAMSKEGQSRIIQGLVTGIGFIGGAAILITGTLELLQLFAPGRHARVSDFIINVSGFWAGVAIVSLYERVCCASRAKASGGRLG